MAYSVSIQGSPTQVAYGSTLTILYDTTGAAGPSIIDVTDGGNTPLAGTRTPVSVTGIAANTTGTTTIALNDTPATYDAFEPSNLRAVVYMNDEIAAEASYVFNIMTPPLLSSTAQTLTSITIAWTAPPIGGLAPITAQLQKSAHGADSWSNVAGGTTSPKEVTGLSAGTIYDFRVVFSDANPPPQTATSETLTASTLSYAKPARNGLGLGLSL